MSLPEASPQSGAVPVVKLVNLIVRDGINSGASEILLESGAGSNVVQFRIDGRLHEHMRVPAETMPRVLRRMAVLSKLFPIKPADVQEGTARVQIRGTLYELGVTFTPSPGGHNLSLRVLPVLETE